MKKMAFVAAAVAAAGVTLFSSTRVLAQPAPPPDEVQVSQAEVNRAVDRHLHALLRARLHQLQEERAWAMGFR